MTDRTSTDHLPALDGWRGVAILLVLGAHFGNVAAFGLLGVQVFFVLSGLLMTRLLFEQRMPLPRFYRRRFARIVPVFLLYLLAMALLAAVWPVPDTPPGSLAWAAVFLRTYLPGSDIWTDPLTGHLWSLNVEEHGYLAMSLMAIGLSTRPRAAALGLGLVALACLLVFALYRANPLWAPPGTTAPVLRTEVAAFSIFAAATLRVLLQQVRWAPGPNVFLAALAVLLAVIVFVESGWALHGRNLLMHFVVPALLALLVNLLAIESAAPALLRRALSLSWLRWFGVVSYSMYLWHYPLWRFTGGFDSPIVSALACAASIGLAALSFRFFESPMRRWINGKG